MGNSKKILIVDDDPDIRTLLKVRLTAHRFEVLEAEDGRVAVTLAKQEKPDLILLDILMPGQDGIETYQILRKDPITQDIFVIFLTVLAEEVDLNKYGIDLEKGYAILSKSYQAHELIQVIQKALGLPVKDSRGI
jgi:CheY-like chemotaxis protein